MSGIRMVATISYGSVNYLCINDKSHQKYLLNSILKSIFIKTGRTIASQSDMEGRLPLVRHALL